MPRRTFPVEFLPAADPAGGNRALVGGGSPRLTRRLIERGYRPTVLDQAAAPSVGDVERFPWSTGSFAAVLLLDLLAELPDDQAVVDEAARLLRPGGVLLVRVPYRGPLAWLDAVNLPRYLGDIRGGTAKSFDPHAIGWRRHYRRRDVTELLGRRFQVSTAVGTGFGLAEIARLALWLGGRLVVPRERLAQRMETLVGALERAEGRLCLGPLGYHLTVVAERREDGTDRL